MASNVCMLTARSLTDVGGLAEVDRPLTATAAVIDWLESHKRCLEMWRDLLVMRGESPALVEALDRQAGWLAHTARAATD